LPIASAARRAHVEGADQVDVDGALEHVQRMRAVLADGLDGRRHAGAVDQAAQRAHGHGCGDDRLAVGFRGDVALDELAAEFGGQRGARFSLHVGQHDLAAGFGDHARGGRAQARRAAGDDEYIVLNLHGFPSLRVLFNVYVNVNPGL
jgi:hypothetical protein